MTVSIDARSLMIEAIEADLARGEITLGDAVKRLRGEVTKLQQTQFARMCKISVRTLIQIEHNEGNPTLKSLNAVFKPFGLQMGVVRLPRPF
ncbi:MAG: helix-turn-helix transcriptional regulator [Pseudomonas lundensis]|uniref:helix-turn-helix domain-containing protein n=1 Tax=Pseudomonas lundensis TaxID=86185 RepID=UPI0006426F4E|nr:helix-turn-helix transcriptional regulator [Pseudomonas lundensis]NLU02089.1 helix-turn-helix transcriptional regulator [Pseudomonas lundensis]NNA28914.1 helix-turn-helix transcriptional regulator [Pseudomonas lundensis]NNA38292.1 helix-turn-helix transcriptional regulator [Pseudomonas lundensis]OZY49602.1 XRE family transcriptional regulator [Pseudomonas lundensis]